MTRKGEPIVILMADDDEDDRLLARDALAESRVHNDLRFVEDGVELLRYLRQEGEYADAPHPGVVLLDLNMPRMDGREALEAIKADPKLRRIPVVVMTTSQADEDILKSYDLGASSFITKPITFEGLFNVMKALGRYWIEIVELPQP
jgi:two-component system response regulator